MSETIQQDRSTDTVSVKEIRSWASQLASESRRLDWVAYWYVWPDNLSRIFRDLEAMNGKVIALVGVQGMGKSSALQAILIYEALMEDDSRRKASKKNSTSRSEFSVVLFKWRRRNELFSSLLNGTHELSGDFRYRYCAKLLESLESRVPLLDTREVRKHPETLNVDWVEKRLGGAEVKRLRQTALLELLRSKKAILIDTPDYSRTDRRLMARDLEDMHWMWDSICRPRSVKDDRNPTLVIAIQKEMFHGHYFFGKMEKIELTPLRPEQILEAYKRRFKTADPFTEDALFTLARMSRGVFRCFLRHISLVIDAWVAFPEPRRPIDTELVKKTITTERLAEDVEQELLNLFPKQSDLRLQAVRILMHLEESGPSLQGHLAEQLDIPPYAMSRLLAKLESHRYVTRRRSGNDKIVAMRNTSMTSEKESLAVKSTNQTSAPDQKAPLPHNHARRVHEKSIALQSCN